MGKRLFGELQVDDTRLDQRGAVFTVDLEDAVHPREADDDSALLWNRPAGETGAGAAGDHWQTSLASQDDDLGHLLRRRRQGDRAWGGGLDGAIDAAVVLVDEQVGWARKDRVSADDAPQLFDKRFAIHDGSHHSLFQARRSRREICQWYRVRGMESPANRRSFPWYSTWPGTSTGHGEGVSWTGRDILHQVAPCIASSARAHDAKGATT